MFPNQGESMITADKLISQKELKKLINKLEHEKNKALKEIQANPNKSLPGETRTVLDYFLFNLISMTGVRVSEGIKLRLTDFMPDYLIIRKENSKNKKKGTVYFGDKTRNLIYELVEFHTKYLTQYGTDYLFPSHSRDGHLTRSYAHKRFKYWLMLTGLLLHHSIHSMRHGYATYSLDKGLPLTFVRDQLRHAGISITSQYLHLTKENRDRIKDIF